MAGAEFCNMKLTSTIYNQQSGTTRDLGPVIQRLTDLTRESLMVSDHKKAKQYIDITENMYKTGDKRTKHQIATIFIFSVSSFLEIRGLNVREIFPEALCAEYYNQVNASGL
jgi:hypothetical protein